MRYVAIENDLIRDLLKRTCRCGRQTVAVENCCGGLEKSCKEYANRKICTLHTCVCIIGAPKGNVQILNGVGKGTVYVYVFCSQRCGELTEELVKLQALLIG